MIIASKTSYDDIKMSNCVTWSYGMDFSSYYDIWYNYFLCITESSYMCYSFALQWTPMAVVIPKLKQVS